MSELLRLTGKNIREIRNAQKLTQQELAEKAGISSKYLGEIERAEVNLSVDVLGLIGKGLGVDACMLIASDVDTEESQKIHDIEMILHALDSEHVELLYILAKAMRDIRRD